MRRALAFAVIPLFLATGLARAEDQRDPIVDEASRNKSFVLAEFVSQSCPACDEMRPVVNAVLAQHPSVRHQVHDADLEPELAKKYRVRCVPVYVVVDPEGQVKFNDVGMMTQDQLDQILHGSGLGSR